jgi:hypothetical protein
MERVQVLIDKLVTQKAAGASPSELLLTVQFLQQELLKLREAAVPAGSSSIAVVMPSNLAILPGVDMDEYLNREYLTLEMEEEVEEAEAPIAKQPEKPAGYMLKKPAVDEPKIEREKPKKETSTPGVFSFDVADETPTLLHQPQKEIHEVIGKKDPSLNDKLKEEKTELAHTLKDAPVKDLRKAIGVNDKFVFINELFRGDEAMYDRSIKTINNFQILTEAEYWITRELKLKLGWDNQSATVKHFDQVVKRRFS